MKAFLDHFAAILGSLTVGLLMLSVSHEWGYFYNVGSHFQTFLTTTDYLANAILWLPWAAIFMYAWVNWGVLKEGKPPTEKRDWRRLRSWVWPGIVVFFFVSILMLATWPPSYFTIAYFAGVFVAAWSFVWPMHAQKIQGVDDDLAKIWRNVIRLGPPVVAVVVGYGFVSAEQDLARKRDPYLLHFKSGATEPRVLLRNFDRGVLVRNPVENRVEFHKWDDVVRIDKQIPDKSRIVLCWFIEEWCPSERPPVP